MPRIRTIKPEVALHEGLYDLEQETGLPIRFAWAVMPCHCDREGRFEWKPRRLGAQILPYDDIDFSRVLHAWATRGFVVKYRVGDAWFGCLPTFLKHQVINNREQASELPGPDHPDAVVLDANQEVADACPTRAPRVGDACPTALGLDQGEGKGREGKEGDSLRSSPSAPSSADADSAPAERSPDTAELDLEPPGKPPDPIDPVVIEISATGGDTVEITQGQVDQWREAYPAVEVFTEIKRAAAWQDANPKHRKTAQGMRRFLVNWLGRAQDRAPRSAGGPHDHGARERAADSPRLGVAERGRRAIDAVRAAEAAAEGRGGG